MYKVIYDKYQKVRTKIVKTQCTIECSDFDEACTCASRCKGAVYAPNGLRLLKYN